MTPDEPIDEPAHDRCPPWCVSDHDEQTFADDRYHDSATAYVDVLLNNELDPVQPTPPESTQLLIVTSRRRGEREDWVFIGEPDRRRQRLHLSRESAERLLTALTRHLDDLASGGRP